MSPRDYPRLTLRINCHSKPIVIKLRPLRTTPPINLIPLLMPLPPNRVNLPIHPYTQITCLTRHVNKRSPLIPENGPLLLDDPGITIVVDCDSVAENFFLDFPGLASPPFDLETVGAFDFLTKGPDSAVAADADILSLAALFLPDNATVTATRSKDFLHILLGLAYAFRE